MSQLLTLDLSSYVGWTCGKPDDRQFGYGTQVLAKGEPEDIGGFIQSFDDWLSEALVDVDLVVFESPLFLSKSSITTLRKLYGQAAHLEWRCRQAKVECREVNNMTVKRFMGVSGIHGADGKRAMIAAVRHYGYEPDDDDAADAIAIRLYSIVLLWPERSAAFGLELGPLGAMG